MAYTAFYFTEYRHAEKKATDLMNGTENVSVIKENYGLFLNGSGNDTLFIFYPGAKNEYVSYLPLLMDISNGGVDSALVEMPLNFAFFGENTADSIIDSTNYSHYVLAGQAKVMRLYCWQHILIVVLIFLYCQYMALKMAY